MEMEERGEEREEGEEGEDPHLLLFNILILPRCNNQSPQPIYNTRSTPQFEAEFSSGFIRVFRLTNVCFSVGLLHG